MGKTPVKIKRPLWVASLNIGLALTVGSTQAFADTPITSQADLEAIGANVDSLGGNYVVTESFEVVDPFAGGNTYVTGTFTGTFVGGDFTISGLTKPLFDVISGDVSDLNLASGTGESGVIGNGALANILEAGGTIDNVSFTGDVTGTADVGGLVGYSSGDISNSSATGVVTGIGNNVGGLVGLTNGTIDNSYAAGEVDGGAYAVGGLVGYSAGAITNSSATVAVEGNINVGGLVGESSLTSTIDYSIAAGTVTGTNNVGGLAGYSEGDIDNSYATGNVKGEDNFGGLVGSSEGDIDNSYAKGNVTSISAGCECGDAGGLVGFAQGDITNSHASGDVSGDYDIGGLVGDLEYTGFITNSYATGNVSATGTDGDWNNGWGGLVGESGGIILNSYATGNVVADYNYGSLIGYLMLDAELELQTPNSFATGSTSSANNIEEIDVDVALDGRGGFIGCAVGDGADGYDCNDEYQTFPTPTPSILSVVNTPFGVDPVPAFAVSASINDGLPYLISLEDSYDVVEEDTEETPSYSLRSFYTQAAKSLDKALTSLGFKSNFSSHPTLGFQALEQNQSNSPAVIQLFEVSEYQNSNILLSKEDGFQLSISSYYKEPVEIWTQGLNGEYLYLGLVEFDKDGKAILPALKFDTANTYQLLMIKAADKLSEKPNLEAKLGQININVF